MPDIESAMPLVTGQECPLQATGLARHGMMSWVMARNDMRTVNMRRKGGDPHPSPLPSGEGETLVRHAGLGLLIILPMLCGAGAGAAEADGAKPRVAFFPLGGDAKEQLRQQCGLSLRLKLDRTGKYDVIDGPKMLEVAGEAKDPVMFSTASRDVIELGKLVEAQVLVWGELVNTADGATMKLKMLDLRDADRRPRELTKVIREPTDLRFVSEEILETLPGVGKFERPVDEPVTNDATAAELWKKNPNLVKNGDFAAAGLWKGIYMSEYYDVPLSKALPAEDKVVIYPLEEGGTKNNVLAMRLSRTCAENNGLAALSERIDIAPDTRYRLSFRYKSYGPTLHVFVKGYTLAENIKGQKVEREIYRRQVPPSGSTDGRWVTIVDDMNPQHVAFPVLYLRVDLYAYLSPGTVMFDDVVLKAVGKQTHKASDDAIKKPVRK